MFKVLLTISTLITFAGCGSLSSTPKPKLYGANSCGDKTKTAYPTVNGWAAVCMDEKKAAYMLCVRELGTASVTSNKNSDTSVSASVKIPEIPADVSTEVKNKLVNNMSVLYQNEGELASARAAAIKACIKFLE